MAARAYWKGFLRLSLVTCPVALFPASSKSQKTRFHQINKKTGHRLRQQMVDEETGRVVDKDNKGRGYELTKGKFVEIPRNPGRGRGASSKLPDAAAVAFCTTASYIPQLR